MNRIVETYKAESYKEVVSNVREWLNEHRTLLMQLGAVFAALIIAGLCFAAGMSFQSSSATSESGSQLFNRQVGSYKYISPLLDCGYPTDKSSLDIKAVIDQRIATEVGNGNIKFASVYFRDLSNGPWVGVNSRELFSPASLMKVPVMISYMRWAMVEPKILKEKILYTEDMGEAIPQNIVAETKLEHGKEYPIDQLLELLITESNNTALLLLSQRIGIEYLDETYKRLGISLEGANNNPMGNTITVVGYATFFRVLYNASYLSSDMSEKALSILARTKFVDGLRAGVPDSIEVAHKFGERRFTDTNELQLHDCGIVYVPDKPYLLCIMTKGDDFDTMAQSISSLSADVYEVFTE